MLTFGVTVVAAVAGGASGYPAAHAAAAHAAGQAAGPQRDRDDSDPTVQLPGWAWTLIGVVIAGIVGLRFAHDPALPAYLALAVGAVLLSAVDLAAFRISDRMLGATALAVVLYLVAQALLDAHPSPIERAALAAVAVGVSFLVIALLAGGKFGLGDVKLLSLIAFVLGYKSWISLEDGIMLGLLLNVAVGLSLKATRSIHSLPLAPCLLAGALVALVV